MFLRKRVPACMCVAIAIFLAVAEIIHCPPESLISNLGAAAAAAAAAVVV